MKSLQLHCSKVRSLVMILTLISIINTTLPLKLSMHVMEINLWTFKSLTLASLGGGSSILPDCYLCSEKICRNDLWIAKLDCHHMFHRKCVTEFWNGKDSKRCPICKEKHFFDESYDLSEQLHNRFFKFIINWFCERCLSYIEERKDCIVFNNLLGDDRSCLWVQFNW